MAVSIQQASANALGVWIQTQMPDCVVLPRWPLGAKLPAKAISIVTAGARQDIPFVFPEIISKANSGATNTTAVYRIAACNQPFQLDVWATTHNDRDDIVARLDPILRADSLPLNLYNSPPYGAGVLVAVQDGWQAVGTIADFDFDSPNTDDTGDSLTTSEYRATYAGGAQMMLTASATTARQVRITYQQLIQAVGSPDADTTLYRVP